MDGIFSNQKFTLPFSAGEGKSGLTKPNILRKGEQMQRLKRVQETKRRSGFKMRDDEGTDRVTEETVEKIEWTSLRPSRNRGCELGGGVERKFALETGGKVEHVCDAKNTNRGGVGGGRPPRRKAVKLLAYDILSVSRRKLTR